MGHTWREIDPAGAEAQDRYLDRLVALRKKFDARRIGCFTGAEFRLYLKLIGVETKGDQHLTDEDFKKLEGLLSEWKTLPARKAKKKK